MKRYTKSILLLSLISIGIFFVACNAQPQVEEPVVEEIEEATEVEIQEEAPAETEEEEEIASEPEVDHCVECHVDKEMLIATANEEVHVESENEGAG